MQDVRKKTNRHVMFRNKNVMKTNRILADIPLHKYGPRSFSQSAVQSRFLML